MMTTLSPASRAATRGWSDITIRNLFVIPTVAFLIIFNVFPLLYSLGFSFTDFRASSKDPVNFVGLKNYLSWTQLKSGRILWSGVLTDPAWWNAVWNTVRFAFVSVLLETIFGTVVALVLNAEFKGRGIVRAAILVPWAIPTIVSAKMWGWMLNDQFGIVNDLLLRMHLIDHKIALYERWIARA